MAVEVMALLFMQGRFFVVSKLDMQYTERVFGMNTLEISAVQVGASGVRPAPSFFAHSRTR